ncbi:histone deacetylase complex subunit SAP30 [Puma concolor]|uniref:Histone deacetylase complex subunit SAP30 n=1 Tax=Puma concolor TaxID=9696 RepID=A0A6P6HRI1_PUMCO|nr:histone deacetylase complex subunit SAP30 [Puma concolor]
MNGFTPEEMSRGGDAAAAAPSGMEAPSLFCCPRWRLTPGSSSPCVGKVESCHDRGPDNLSKKDPFPRSCKYRVREAELTPRLAGSGDCERCQHLAQLLGTWGTRSLCCFAIRLAAIGIFFSARHLYICDYHKNLIQSVRNRRKRKGSDDDGGDSPVQDIDTPEVDLYQLQVNTLRRYKRHFKLSTRPGLNKAQLVEIVGCHFRSIPVNEKDTLTYFIYSVKNDKNKSDLKVDSGVH